MDRKTFGMLCELLRTHGGLKMCGSVAIEEQVCMFLYILAHHVKNRTVHDMFGQSGVTVSRYFNLVLNAVLRLHEILLKVPDPVPNNCTEERWKWFKNCLGALDGTYIKGWEGSASDSRVLRDAIYRPHGLKDIITLWMLVTQIVRDFLRPTEERDITYRNREKD
ncbi:PREDICTED: ALP1, partial [Prunus dulcis]